MFIVFGLFAELAACKTSCPPGSRSCLGRLRSARKTPRHEQSLKNDHQLCHARGHLVREASQSAPSLSEFPRSSSSGSSLSLLPAGPAAPLLQARASDDCTPLKKQPGTSMASKRTNNFALQGAARCESSCAPRQERISEFPCSSSSGSFR